MNYSIKHKIANFLILDSKAVMFLNTAIYMTPICICIIACFVEKESRQMKNTKVKTEHSSKQKKNNTLLI